MNTIEDRRSIETYPELSDWYNNKYFEMGGTWRTPFEECDRHLDDLGVPRDPNALLLDIGCGGGDFLLRASLRVRCIGIEISQMALEYAKERIKDTGLPINLANANIETLKGSTQFDYIVSMGSLEHVLDIDAALRSIHALLKPTGKFYFYLPNEKWVHKDQPNERTGTQAAWIDLLAKHGLEVQSVKRWNDSDAYTGTVVQGPSMHQCLEVAGPAVESIPFDWNSIAPEQWRDVAAKINRNFRKLCLNIGSGQRPFHTEGDCLWKNIDAQARWNPDIVADGADLKAHFADNTADMIVLHHVLEHFGCGEADGLLKECYRILKPGGSLIVTVPDMEALADHWELTGHPDARPRISTQIYMTNVYGAYMGDEADRHNWGYDETSLTQTLRNAGFKAVQPFDFRSIIGADIAQDFWILGAEAIK